LSVSSIHFDSIKIDGYRGRNFELKMNPPGKNTVFIMDGNTGKTTTIELLRWCFSYPQSEAIGTFKHMWTRHAHVLDFDKKGESQTCSITINFHDQETNYSFKRITKGTYLRNEEKKEDGDCIDSIKDTLEFNFGKGFLENDQVHQYLTEKFKFENSAEYFCFDGEKARYIMMSAADTFKIKQLIDSINQRTTNPKLEEYEETLESLKRKIYREAGSKLSNQALKNAISDIIKKEVHLKKAEIDLQDTSDTILECKSAISQIRKEKIKYEKEITEKNSNALVKKISLERDSKEISRVIENERKNIYGDCLSWIQFNDDHKISYIKNNVRETGNLPEPYRQQLINDCLRGPAPTCQICGRKLNKEGMENVKSLEKMMASHEVHNFLSNDFIPSSSNFNFNNRHESIKKHLIEYVDVTKKLDNIELSNTDEKLINRVNSLKMDIDDLIEKKGQRELDEETINACIKELRKDIQYLKDKNELLNKNRDLLEKVDFTLELIKKTKENTKLIAIGVISRVISDGVSSILGPNFSARLTVEDGLLLGEGGYYSAEAGGMSGRLILSYCFAEAMTLIDPLIVDTPSGNIGGHREALAKHLNDNHEQLILLCLPTEIEDFAPHIAKNNEFIEIKNDRR